MPGLTEGNPGPGSPVLESFMWFTRQTAEASGQGPVPHLPDFTPSPAAAEPRGHHSLDLPHPPGDAVGGLWETRRPFRRVSGRLLTEQGAPQLSELARYFVYLMGQGK